MVKSLFTGLTLGLICLSLMSCTSSEKKDDKFKSSFETSSKSDSYVPAGQMLCRSANEFEKAYAFLRDQKDIEIFDKQSTDLALEITKGCDGAAKRFIAIFNLLTKSGVDLHKSLEIAIQFSKLNDKQTDNFITFFKSTFLENYYDLDFATAIAISVDLALEAKSNPETTKKDFIKLMNFCLDSKKIGLPMSTCSKLSLEIVQYNTLYDIKGIAPHFEELMSFFSNQRDLSYNVKTAYQVAHKVLKHGPLAVQNFRQFYKNATEGSLSLPATNAFELALKISELSMKEDPTQKESTIK